MQVNEENKALTKVKGILMSDSCKYLPSTMALSSILLKELDNLFTLLE